MSTDPTITTENVTSILKHALLNKPVRQIATYVDLPVAEVQEILDLNGHPDEKAMRRRLDVLTHREVVPVLSAVSAKPRPPATVTVLPAPVAGGPTPDQVIVAAQKSTSTKVKRAVARAVKARQAFQDAMTNLTAVMEEDSEAAKVRAEIADLEKKLAKARAKLGLKPTAVPGPKSGGASWGLPPGTSPAQVRTWARDHDLPVPEQGRIPKSIVDQFITARSAAGQDKVEALYEQAWPTPRPGAEA